MRTSVPVLQGNGLRLLESGNRTTFGSLPREPKNRKYNFLYNNKYYLKNLGPCRNMTKKSIISILLASRRFLSGINEIIHVRRCMRSFVLLAKAMKRKA